MCSSIYWRSSKSSLCFFVWQESEGHDGHSSSPAVDLRTRWAGISLRAKESLSKTTSELKSLWSRGSARNGHPGSGTAA